MKPNFHHTLLCAAALALGLGHAQAADVAPPGLLSTWTCVGQCGASAADGDIVLSPLASPAYGYVATAGSTAYGASPLVLGSNSRGSETNGSVITSGAFNAATGDLLDVQFNYVSTDGKGYDDYAWARLLGGCRALGRACAGASFGASLGAGEAWGHAPQRAGNDGWRRKSPRPFGLTRKVGSAVVANARHAARHGCACAPSPTLSLSCSFLALTRRKPLSALDFGLATECSAIIV